MKLVLRVICCLILSTTLWGCAMHAGSPANSEATQTYDDALRRLRMGFNEEQVRTLLGPPGKSEFYESLEGAPVLVLHYESPGAVPGPGGKTERTSLFFENGNLVMWGSNFYE